MLQNLAEPPRPEYLYGIVTPTPPTTTDGLISSIFLILIPFVLSYRQASNYFRQASK